MTAPDRKQKEFSVHKRSGKSDQRGEELPKKRKKRKEIKKELAAPAS